MPEGPITGELWPQTPSAATALRAAVAAFALTVSGPVQMRTAAPHKLCARLAAELGRPDTLTAIQVGRADDGRLQMCRVARTRTGITITCTPKCIAL